MKLLIQPIGEDLKVTEVEGDGLGDMIRVALENLVVGVVIVQDDRIALTVLNKVGDTTIYSIEIGDHRRAVLVEDGDIVSALKKELDKYKDF